MVDDNQTDAADDDRRNTGQVSCPKENRERKESIEGGVVGLRPNQTWKSIQ